MSYENDDRRWMEDQFKEITRRLVVYDHFMGQMGEANTHRVDQLHMVTRDMELLRDELLGKLDETNKKVDGLLGKINKWEAKLGSFMFIAGCLWAFFVVMKDHILAFIKG
jgi:hypothetical protein